MIARGIYPITDALLDWASNNLLSIEQSTFFYFRGIAQLIELVDAAESKRIHKFAALSAIRNYNERNNTDITYENILSRDTTYIPTGVGDWLVFTDDDAPIVFGPHDDPEAALSDTPDSVSTVLVWDPSYDHICVYKSPRIAPREQIKSEDGVVFADGQVGGSVQTYVLPSVVEASLYAMRQGELVENWNGGKH